jgi:hypothetical protein
LQRVDLIKPGVPEALKRAGCEVVWVGAESGAQKILDAMDKGTKVEQIYAAARSLHAAGIKIGFFLQFGYPSEDLDDIEATLRMVRECEPDDIGMSVSYPLPGTKFYENVKAQLGEKQNWLNSADLAMMYQGPYPTEFYRKLHVVLHKEFRSRKTWRNLRNGGKHLPVHKRARDAASMVYNWATLPIERRKLAQMATPLKGAGTIASDHDPRSRRDPLRAGGALEMSETAEMVKRHKVVLYNPRAVFWTMPLGLIAVGSALDPTRFEVRIIDARLEADPVARLLSEANGALCVGMGVLTGDPIHDALRASRAVKQSYPHLPLCGAAGTRLSSQRSASKNRR